MNTPQPNRLVAQASASALGQLRQLPSTTELTDDDVESIYADGYALAEAGRHEEAFERVTLAAAFRPQNLRYLRGRAVLLSKAGRFSEAMTVYRALDAFEPCRPDNLFGMVEAALGMNLRKLAANLLQQYVAWAERATPKAAELAKARALLEMLSKGADDASR
ncbi:MAG: hypothetical protein V4609_01945 [Pseudomonadota bacterium]